MLRNKWILNCGRTCMQIDGLHVLLQSYSFINCQCISKVPRWQPKGASLCSLDLRLDVHVQTHSITACKCISEFTPSRPPSQSLHSLRLGQQAHLQIPSITASKFLSKLNRSHPPRTSHCWLDLGLQVHLQPNLLRASKYIVQERPWVYADNGVMVVKCMKRGIYSGDPGVDRQHLIFISGYYTTKIQTLSFRAVGLSHSVQDFVDRCNCMDPHGRVVSYHLIFLLRSSRLM